MTFITPLFISNGYYLFVGGLLALYIMVAIGMNVVTGFTGQFSLAHGALAALGAYTMANLTVMHGWPWWAALAPSIAVPALVGALLTLPALRLSKWYFAMVTVLVAGLVQELLLDLPSLTGGGSGIAGVAQISVAGNAFTARALLYAFLAIDAVLLYMTWNLSRSPWGGAMRAVRDDEIAARSAGISVPLVKMLAFIISAMAAGLMGALYANFTGAISPDLFSLDLGILILLMVVIGGAGFLEAPILGALVMFAIPTLLLDIARQRAFAYAALLLVTVIVAPKGIGGGIRAVTLRLGLRGRGLGQPRLAVISDNSEARFGAHRRGGAVGLTLRGVGLSFGAVIALEDIDVDVAAGSVHGVVGPNGSGKTTLLNVVSGYYQCDHGTVSVGALDVTHKGATRMAQLGVGRTFQQPRALQEETVLENVLLGGYRLRRASLPESLLGMGRAPRELRDRLRRSMDLLSFVGLADQAGIPARNLPHGQLRLMEIARVLAAEPSVVLLDEPAAGLAPDEISRLGDVIRDLSDLSITVVLVEHHVGFVSEIVDTLTVLDLGRIIAQGAASHVLTLDEVVSAYLGPTIGREEGEDLRPVRAIVPHVRADRTVATDGCPDCI